MQSIFLSLLGTIHADPLRRPARLPKAPVRKVPVSTTTPPSATFSWSTLKQTRRQLCQPESKSSSPRAPSPHGARGLHQSRPSGAPHFSHSTRPEQAQKGALLSNQHILGLPGPRVLVASLISHTAPKRHEQMRIN